MCGRTCLTLNKEQICCACSYRTKDSSTYKKPEWLYEHNDGKEYVPSHNIAPTEVTPVLISANKFKETTQLERVLKPMMWGIIPPWHKDNYKSNFLSTNNCRLENIQTSKLYSPILKNGGRCIVIVEGFYEWKTTELAKVKQPYYIYSPQDNEIKVDDISTWNNKYCEDEGWRGINLTYMAGLYSVWQKNETIIYSYTVITMESNDTLSWVHHRMPAILNTQEQIEMWLDVNNVGSDMALSCLKPTKILLWHPVSIAINNSRNKSNNCNKRQTSGSPLPQKTLTSWLVKTDKKKNNEEHTSDLKKMKK